MNPIFNIYNIFGENLKEYKIFVQRIGLAGITNVLFILSTIILLPILTKTFSISDYGIWVQINTTIALLPNIVTLGLPYTMVRFLSAEKNKEKIKEGFYSITFVILASTFIASFLLFLFSNNVALALFNGDVNIVLLLSLIVFFACLNTFLINFFRTFQQMKRYSIFLLLQTYLTLFIVSYFALSGFGIYTSALGILIAYIVTFILMILVIIHNLGFRIPKFNNLREYLLFGIPTIPSNLSYWIVDSSDRYIIGILLGTAYVGFYSPGYTLGNLIILFMAPFSLLLPSVLPKYHKDEDKVRVFLKYSLKYFLLISIPSAFGISLLSKPILLILTTQEIASNGYLITPFVAFSALLYGIYGIIMNIIILEKRTKVIGIIWIIAAFLNLFLNIIFVPYLGIIGAAIITSITFTIAFILTLSYSIRLFKFDFSISFIVKSIIASVIMSFIIVLINPYGLLDIIFTVLICSMVYFVIIILSKGITKEEFIFIKKFFNN